MEDPLTPLEESISRPDVAEQGPPRSRTEPQDNKENEQPAEGGNADENGIENGSGELDEEGDSFAEINKNRDETFKAQPTNTNDEEAPSAVLDKTSESVPEATLPEKRMESSAEILEAEKAGASNNGSASVRNDSEGVGGVSSSSSPTTPPNERAEEPGADPKKEDGTREKAIAAAVAVAVAKGGVVSLRNSRFELRPVSSAGSGTGSSSGVGVLAMEGGASNGKSSSSAAGSAAKDARKERRTKDRKERKKNKSRASCSEDNWHCSYCNVTLHSQHDFQSHCRSDPHQQAIMSDKGREWKHRAPPRGVGSESYTLCRQFMSEGHCRFGAQCVEAHNKEELKEWKERFEYRKNKAQKAAKLYGKSFVDVVLDKLSAAKSQIDTVVRSKILGIDCTCSNDLDTQISSKNECLSWEFELKAGSHLLQDVGLLNDANRRHFSLEYIKHVSKPREEETSGESLDRCLRTFRPQQAEGSEGGGCEWSHPSLAKYASGSYDMTYRVRVSFRTDIFGTFRQSIIFHLSGLEQYLRKDLCVDVVPVLKGGQAGGSDDEDQEEAASRFQEKINKQPERWDETNTTVVDFDPPMIRPEPGDAEIMSRYPTPKPYKYKLSQQVLDPQLTKANYRARMHDLLFIEEMAQFEQLSRFDVVTRLQLTSSYLLMPTSANSSTAKYARPGELFGKMSLGKDLSEDTTAGRLILTNCSMLLLSKPRVGLEAGGSGKKDKKNGKKDKPGSAARRVAYTSAVEDTGKNTLYLRLSQRMVEDFSLKADNELEVEVQFQLNRVPLCEMHFAVDRLPELALIYPDVPSFKKRPPKIPWTPSRQWPEGELPLTGGAQLNPKQREAIVAITAPTQAPDADGPASSSPLPPILIIGPYGTGKTFTLGQAIKLLLRQEGARVLICTHSNSAADLYIRDYLHPHIQENPDVKLRRVYYRNRWVQTVNQTVQKYCLITETETARVFRNPTKEDVEDCHVVVATLSTSRYLGNLGLPAGHFTHILVDEAAQAMECEALMPLALASGKTRIVLAGDHMQLSPEVFSSFATEKRFNKSLLERLYDLYPESFFPCKILLCENYRSHESIIGYTSQLFYNQKLVASGKQSRHERFHPLTVFTARGEDVQDANSTSFYNNSEVYEVVDRVAELQRTWPKTWGMRDDTSIGVVTPYYDQVQRIRSELRKRRLFGVSVERVLNVQGKQFRAIFLSTVRTRKTCVPATFDDGGSGGECDFGFLSNAKLLNTAITRAQSLVAVVGDPVALCSVGRCRRLWERFLELANLNNSLFGLTWQALRAMLDGVELKKTYVLNPFAPAFVPRTSKRSNQDAFLMQMTGAQQQHPPASGPPAHHQAGPPFPPMLPQHHHQQAVAANAAAAAAAAAAQNHHVAQMGAAAAPFYHLHHPHPPPPQPPPPGINQVAAAAAAAAMRAHLNNYTTIPPYPGGAVQSPHQFMKMPAGWNPAAAAAAMAAVSTGSMIPPTSVHIPPPPMGPPRPTGPGVVATTLGPPGWPHQALPHAQQPKSQPPPPLPPHAGPNSGLPGPTPLSPLRHANSSPSLNQHRPMSPVSRRIMTVPVPHHPLQQHVFHHSQQQLQQQFQQQQQQMPPQHRLPNPQFSNTKYQRFSAAAGGTSDSATPATGADVNSGITAALAALAANNPGAAATGAQAPPGGDFQFIKEGVHFPPAAVQRNADAAGSGAAPTPQAVLDMALELLPRDLDLTTVLKSTQIQIAWFNHLMITYGPPKAELFKETVLALQQQRELVPLVERRISALQQHRFQQPHQMFSLSSDRHPGSQPSTPNSGRTSEGVAILAQDLETLMLDGARNPATNNSRSSSSPSSAAGGDPSSNVLTNVLKHNPVLSEILGDDVDSLVASKPDDLLVEAEVATNGVSSSSNSLPLYLRGSGNQHPAADGGAAPASSNLPWELPTFSSRQPPAPAAPSSASVDSFVQLEQRSTDFLQNLASSFSGREPRGGGGGDGNRLTYANVLRNPQKPLPSSSTAPGASRSSADGHAAAAAAPAPGDGNLLGGSDALTSLRNIGTKGNRESESGGGQHSIFRW